MSLRRYVYIGVALSAFAFAMVLALVPSTDDLSPENPLWNGLSNFVSFLNASTIATAEVGGISTSSIVFVIGPSEEFNSYELGILLNYVNKGGILVIADEFGSGAKLVEELGLGVKLTGSPLADPLLMYKTKYFPRVEVKLGGVNYTVYFNYGTTIDVRGGRGVCIGRSSSFSYLDVNANGEVDEGEERGPFCVMYVEGLGAGYVYILSDSSIFINSMMSVGDTIGFLRALVDGRRAYVISDKWRKGAYSTVRSSLLRLMDYAIGTSLRYPLAALLGITSYYLGRRVHRHLTLKKPKGADAASLVDEVLQRHPEWSRELLMKLAEELGGYERAGE